MKGFTLEEITKFGHINTPALFIKGDQSQYIREKDIKAIYNLFRSPIIRVIENAGHWVHAEQQEEFLKAIDPFIRV